MDITNNFCLSKTNQIIRLTLDNFFLLYNVNLTLSSWLIVIFFMVFEKYTGNLGELVKLNIIIPSNDTCPQNTDAQVIPKMAFIELFLRDCTKSPSKISL